MTKANWPRIPQYLRENADQSTRADIRDWVATLPTVISDLAQRWALDVGEPYEPGGLCSWVAPARTATGEDLVLKVGWRHFEAEHEADGLRHWDGNGAIRLHTAEMSQHTSALLIERCVPGTPLGASAPESEQDIVIAALLHQLWTVPPDGHPFRPLEQMCDEWAVAFERDLADSPADLVSGLDAGLVSAGIALFRELPRTAERAALLCTDLHAANVLAAQREPWLVVDPKPYVGDPAYDPLQHMLNCQDRLAQDPVGLSQRMAGLLDLDAERLRLWLFARCVQECLDQPALYEIAVRLAP